ncbi:inositol monophosphatase family protein [Ligilactobacillus ceti]|uniref:Inositol monophosphatase n=1 Tax=Ligilactobacillus ceti DSM 22408 TaxID=1122146 RepID=A0A0R2KHU9_9LACO|nr:inositol monophosphatase family protein [Ligilactobacillus ceti]KRN88930.1 inositol monophosphatase [Ligilactobacillus ceti DSM 22408]
MVAWQEINHQVQSWLKEVRTMILAEMKQQQIQVEQKTCRTDLVTNVDREVEAFYSQKIKESFANSKIHGEECEHATGLHEHPGLFWLIDPIDGTLNFIQQEADFATMLAIFENGKPKLAYIYDVMHDELFWGGPECGVYCNEKEITPPSNCPLEKGLFAMGGNLVLHNRYNIQKIAQQSLGVRVYGCAGIEFTRVLTGKTVGYLACLCPWDYAAGTILAETLGLVVKTIDGQPVNMLSSTDVLVATKSAHKEILKAIHQD